MNKKIVVISTILAILIVIFLKNQFKDINNTETLDELDVNMPSEKTVQNSVNSKIKIHIIGEVNNPGLIEMESGSRIFDAIELAGGVTKDADVSKINLAYILSDGEKIYIPNVNDENSDQLNENKLSSLKININLASQEKLMELPGIGESVAKAIIDYRTKNGKFNSIEEIKNVSGIGDSKFEKIAELISVK